jgi:hypothetical protein
MCNGKLFEIKARAFAASFAFILQEIAPWSMISIPADNGSPLRLRV